VLEVGVGVASSAGLEVLGLATAIAVAASTAVAPAAMLAPILVLRFMVGSLRLQWVAAVGCGRDPTVAAPGRSPISRR